MKTSLDTALSSLPPQPQALGRTQDIVHERYRSQTQDVSISLTTDEGDLITIRQSAMAEHMNAKYKDGEGLRKIDARLSASSMSFEVQGDLNEEELADLSKLLNNLSGIASDFFKGNMNKAIEGAMNIGDMGSFNSLEATFSRTSVLASYLEVPHPLPSFGRYQDDPLLHEAQDQPAKANGSSMMSALTAQWQQFINSLSDQEEATIISQAGDSSVNSASDAGKKMFERAKDTMLEHPRLTPLMPSVADLAVDQAIRQHGPRHYNANQWAQDISNSFNKELNSWLL